MKNRLLYFVLTLFLSFSLAFGLLACGEDSKTTPIDPTTNVEENPTTNVENPSTNIEEEYYEIILHLYVINNIYFITPNFNYFTRRGGFIK